MTVTVDTASGFNRLFFEPNYFRNYATDLRPIFRIVSCMGADNSCKIGLRSLKGRCHCNHFFTNSIYGFFRHSDVCVINFVHSATTRSRSTVDKFGWSWHINTACHGKRISAFSIHGNRFACDRIRLEVQLLPQGLF